MLLETLAQLGKQFESEWRTQKEHSFADCAYQFLSAVELPPFCWDEVERFALRTGNHSDFGDLNIHAYQGETFGIEVLVWGSSSPDLHSHAFSGAFRVLAGGSVHASHAVARVHWSSPQLVLGEVELRDLSVLRAGDTHRIEPGLGFVHGLYHWHEPSVTVVLRTKQDREHPFQFGFSAPRGRLQVLTTGREVSTDPQLRAFRRLISLRPWAEVERVLIEALDELPPWRIWAIYCEQATRLGPEAREAVIAALPEPLRERPPIAMGRSVLREARGLLRTDRSRIAAGLILLAPGRGDLIDALSRAFPQEDPAAWFSAAAAEMCRLLLSDDDEGGLSEIVARTVLAGHPVEQALATLREVYTEDSIAEYEPQVRALHKIVSTEIGHCAAASGSSATPLEETRP